MTYFASDTLATNTWQFKLLRCQSWTWSIMEYHGLHQLQKACPNKMFSPLKFPYRLFHSAVKAPQVLHPCEWNVHWTKWVDDEEIRLTCDSDMNDESSDNTVGYDETSLSVPWWKMGGFTKILEQNGAAHKPTFLEAVSYMKAAVHHCCVFHEIIYDEIIIQTQHESLHESSRFQVRPVCTLQLFPRKYGCSGRTNKEQRNYKEDTKYNPYHPCLNIQHLPGNKERGIQHLAKTLCQFYIFKSASRLKILGPRLGNIAQPGQL